MAANKFTSLFILALLSLTIKSYTQDNTVKTTIFEVNIKCDECEEKIFRNFSAYNGIKSIEVSMPDKCVRICYNPSYNSDISLLNTFKELGYTASIKTENTEVNNDCGCDDKCFAGKRNRF